MIETVAEAARRAHLQLVWTEIGFGSERALRLGAVDLWPLITDLPERHKVIYISAPWLQNQHVLVLPAGTGLPGPDFSGLVSHTAQAVHVRILRGIFPATHSLETREEANAVAKVCDGEAAAAFLESRVALAVLREPPAACASVPLRAHVLPGIQQLGVGATFEAAGAADRIRDEISGLARDGTVAAVMARYSFFGLSDTRATYDRLEAQDKNRRLLYVIGALTGALAITLGLARSLRRARGAALAAEARWRTLVETAPDPIASVGRDGRLQFVSDDPSLVGRRVEELTEADSRERLAAAVTEALAGRPAPQIEVPGWKPDGNPAWYTIRVAPVIANGQVETATLIATDIGERKEIEAEREALIRELKMRNAELETFTYTVSHDLKTPLVTIRECTAWSATSWTSLGSAGQPAFRNIPFGALAREAAAIVYGRLAERGVRVQIAEDLPVVRGDRTRLVQVLQNLLDNAAKFTGDQETPQIQVGFRGMERGMAVLFVGDNGVGIEPAHHEKVFGLFEKLDAASPGTGIGLALVRRIVEFHGGRVWVESEGVSRGATFVLTLPTGSVWTSTAGPSSL